MARTEQEPTITVIDNGPRRGGREFRHPAYGQISAHRSSGGNLSLYGSDFRHNSSVTIEVAESMFTRDLSRDWPHSGKEIVRLTMSEAQWATFVSSLNQGSGVQCTFEHVMGEMKPGIAYRDAAKDHHAEVADTLRDGLAEIAKARSAVLSSGLSKAKQDAILRPLDKAEQELTLNVPFVVDSHSKAMEERVEKAKVEVDAYLTGAVMRAGFQAIKGDSILTIAGPEES